MWTYLLIRKMLIPQPEKEKKGKNSLISYHPFSIRQVEQYFELRVHSAFLTFFVYLALQTMLVCVPENKNKNARSRKVSISQLESILSIASESLAIRSTNTKAY